jgi:hypothetical protein
VVCAVEKAGHARRASRRGRQPVEAKGLARPQACSETNAAPEVSTLNEGGRLAGQTSRFSLSAQQFAVVPGYQTPEVELRGFRKSVSGIHTTWMRTLRLSGRAR